MRLNDITGQRFGRLVATQRTKTAKKGTYWECLCDCGEVVVVLKPNLLTGNTTSCGCFQRETMTKHGKHGDPLNHVWRTITDRCNNPRNREYHNYGKRGISICDEWRHDFQNFYDHVTQLPNYGENGHSLDRIDNDGNYEPGNVRWATKTEQARNTRKNHMLTYGGKTQSLVAWAEEIGMNPASLNKRLRNGWSVEKALTKPIDPIHRNRNYVASNTSSEDTT